MANCRHHLAVHIASKCSPDKCKDKTVLMEEVGVRRVKFNSLNFVSVRNLPDVETQNLTILDTIFEVVENNRHPLKTTIK